MGLPCCTGAFSSCGERALSSCGAQASHGSDFSCCRAQELQAHRFQQLRPAGSVAAACWMQSVGSAVVAHELSCDMWNLSRPRIKLSPALAGGFLPTASTPWLLYHYVMPILIIINFPCSEICSVLKLI